VLAEILPPHVRVLTFGLGLASVFQR